VAAGHAGEAHQSNKEMAAIGFEPEF